MNLKEALEQYRGQLVKIGSAEAFFYIHVVDDTTEDALQKIEGRIKGAIKERIERYKFTFQNAENYVTTQVRRAKAYLSEEEHENPITEKNLRRYEMLASLDEAGIQKMIEDVRATAKKRLNNNIGKLGGFTPILERRVRDIYPSLEEINEGTIILVTGTEQGDYWFKNEYRD